MYVLCIYACILLQGLFRSNYSMFKDALMHILISLWSTYSKVLVGYSILV